MVELAVVADAVEAVAAAAAAAAAATLVGVRSVKIENHVREQNS